MSNGDNCSCETSESHRKDINEELESYQNDQDLFVVNREGDKYYIECPECHSTNIQSRRFFSCCKCHTHFQAYLEDGFSIHRVLMQGGSINTNEEIKLVYLKPSDYFCHIIYGRNDRPEIIDKIKAKHPEAKIVKIARDLRRGKDAHGHSRYNRFVMIPLSVSDGELDSVWKALEGLGAGIQMLSEEGIKKMEGEMKDSARKEDEQP